MKNKAWLVCIFLLAVINIILFWPGNLYFLNDDLLHIPLTDQGYLFQTNSVRPVHELLVKLELFFSLKNACGYHITALLLHFIVCIQLFDLCLLIQVKWLQIPLQQAMQAALLAVVLFLAYSQSSESLGWILGRAPVLSAVFVMIALRLFFTRNYKWYNCFGGAFFFAVNLFAYEQTLLLPLVLMVAAFMEMEREKRRGMFKYASVLCVVSIAYIIARKVITSEVAGMYEAGNFLRMNWGTLVANAFRIIFRMILSPAPKTTFAASAVILLLVAGFIIYSAKKLSSNRKAIIFFASIILALIVPVVSLGLAVNSFESGRFLYLPSIFFIIGLSIAGFDIVLQTERIKVPLLVFLVCLIAYWLEGKYTASKFYTNASLYSKSIHLKVQEHFKTSSDTLYLDTLHVTVHRLPVFRRGFKTGIHWLNDKIDTNKIVVKYFHDEVVHRELQ
ncbi:hypothetical protein [Segetibacter sp.]|jgi:hypothetical protein|uniref:hypothetical protein n=1 Tax=Segetibacter sp. TaxID=2231182 RepID=UPI00261FDA10|nr:hypothetical protein [Segetibacter sp.]MCW3081401.1 hypothetical protein [Segetibacter sp.]